MRNKKTFAELEFCDAFLFAATMEDEELCRRVLERILEFPIKPVRVHTEDTIFVDSDYHGVRLDVHANDEKGSLYNVEMQVKNEGNLPGVFEYQRQKPTGYPRRIGQISPVCGGFRVCIGSSER